MIKYDSYKDSGIEWLEELPNHWEINRLKNIFSFGTGLSITKKNLFDLGVPCVNYGEIHSKYGFQVNPQVHILKCVEEDYLKTSKKSLLKRGDFIFADTSEDIEGSGNFTYLNSVIKVFAGYHTIAAKPKRKINSRFIAYLLDSISYRSQFRSNVAGIKVYSITQGLLNKLKIFFPTNQEQSAIAQYLDTKTQAIDKKVNLLEKKIVFYKELRKSIINSIVSGKWLIVNGKLVEPAETKDSGIDWIGQIPEHWELKRLKDISKSLSSGATPTSGNMLYYEDGTVSWLNTGDLNDGLITETSKKLNKIVFSDYPNLKIQKAGTLVIAMYGATIGKMGILNIEATTNQACCCIDLKNNFNTKFLFYQLLSIKEIIISLSVGGTQPNVSQSILGFVKLLIPTLQEQTEIATYLDHKTQTIDKIVGNIQNQITTLKELRKTLINDVVTGKIKVVE